MMRVAVLGAGIMGACLAILLARRGVAVALYDKEAAPMSCASRWNEGKIHLGYLYGADPTLATARHILPGSLRFAELLGEVIGADPRSRASSSDDVFVVHRDSIVPPGQLDAVFTRIDELVQEHPDASRYLFDVSEAKHQRLTATELEAISGAPEIIDGYRIPERSVDTRWIANLIAEAVAAEPLIEFRSGSRVTSATPVDLPSGRWHVKTEAGDAEPFDLVVNALWEGRLAIDITAGLEPPLGWSHRFRLCVFGRSTTPLEVPSTLITLGGFGDVKNYDGHNFYMSWYPVGLVAKGGEVTPPLSPTLDADGKVEFLCRVRAALTHLLPRTAKIFEEAELEVGGGYVFAQSSGDIDDPKATIHKRDRFGIERTGNYLSVDTGKYCTAPWLAARVASIIAET